MHVNNEDYFHYHPPTKLWEGHVFTSVCHSVHGGWVGMPVPCPFRDVGYAWSQVPSRGWIYQEVGILGIPTPQKVHSSVLTSSGGHRSGRTHLLECFLVFIVGSRVSFVNHGNSSKHCSNASHYRFGYSSIAFCWPSPIFQLFLFA